MQKLYLATLLLLSALNSTAQSKQQIAAIGDLKVAGGKINDCKVGYRSHGKLNADKSNGVLLLTWFGGSSRDLDNGGTFATVDTTKYFLLIADALGNGVSSSPSNSVKQHGRSFPEFSVADMVESQYLLLTRKFGIKHLHAIMGISMGGIQTFQWSVTYPGFADLLIPIVGTPQFTSYDQMRGEVYRGIIENDPDYDHGNYKVNPKISLINMFWELFLTTPTEKVRAHPQDNFEKWYADIKAQQHSDWNDTWYQSTALKNFDIAKPYGGSLAETAKQIKAKMLIINATQDHIVNPKPAIDFAKLLPAKLVLLDSDAGHLAANFGNAELRKAVIAFLAGE